MGDLVVSERNLLQRVNIIGSTGKGLRDTHSLNMQGYYYIRSLPLTSPVTPHKKSEILSSSNAKQSSMLLCSHHQIPYAFIHASV